MAFPTPTINFDSITTPGGIGQGLAAVGASLARAKAIRERTALEQQGLARLQAKDDQDMRHRMSVMEEQKRHNLAQEDLRRQGLSRLQGKPEDPLLEEKRGLIQAQTAKLNRPPAPRVAAPMSHEARVGYMKLVEQAKADLRAKALIDPAYKAVPGGMFSSGTPAQRNLEADLKELENTHPAAIALREAQTAQQAPVAANAAPNGAGTLRARVMARFGNQPIPPDWELSLSEAEADDADALQQLEEMLADEPQADTLGLDVGP